MGVRMNTKALALTIAVFVLGYFLGTSSYNYQYYSIPNKYSDAAQQLATIEYTEKDNLDLPSPHSRINIDQISVYDNEVILKVNNAKWAFFTDTKSMEPVIDSKSKAIEIIPKYEQEIHVGDIISYQPEYNAGLVTHRVKETGYDSLGWYAILQGDNNENVDPGKVRFNQVKRILVAIIY